jgi:nucleoside-diphosphate-sugar epimerase
MKKILVTGSDGFIGSELVKKLAGQGLQVIGFDISDGNIADAGSLDHLQKEGISHIFHLAGKSYVPESWSDPASFYRTNVLGTVNILELCRKTGARLTFMSSYVYGKPHYLPIDENHPVKAYNPYSQTKLLAEEIVRFYQSQFTIGCTIMRPFNIYGPGQNKHFLIPELVSKILDPGIGVIEVMDLRPRRDFIYISDMVEALFLSMDGPEGTYNVGSGISFSVEDVVREIMDVAKINKPYIGKKIERPNEIIDLYADASLIRERFKWSPEISFREGISRCVRLHS